MTVYRGNPYLMFEDTANATLISRGAAGDTNVTVNNAKRRAITEREVGASNGFLSSGNVFINLPNPSTVPKEGDGITLGGVTYSIISVETIVWANVYRCQCKQER